MIERILNKETYNSNGTMTFALHHLDCKSNLVDVFKILATQSYESKMHAYTILSEQEFEFNGDDLKKMSSIWEMVKSKQAKTQELDQETYKMIYVAYNGFATYRNS